MDTNKGEVVKRNNCHKKETLIVFNVNINCV